MWPGYIALNELLNYYTMRTFVGEYIEPLLLERYHSFVGFDDVTREILEYLLYIVKESKKGKDEADQIYKDYLHLDQYNVQRGMSMYPLSYAYEKSTHSLLKCTDKIETKPGCYRFFIRFGSSKYPMLKDGKLVKTHLDYLMQVNSFETHKGAIVLDVNLDILMSLYSKFESEWKKRTISYILSYLRSTLNHEFLHSAEMVFGERVDQATKKVTDPTMRDSEFHLDWERRIAELTVRGARQDLLSLMYLLEPSERRAKLSATYSFIKNMNPMLLDQLLDISNPNHRSITQDSISTLIKKLGKMSYNEDEKRYMKGYDPTEYALMANGFNKIAQNLGSHPLDDEVVAFLQVNSDKRVFSKYGIPKDDKKTPIEIERDPVLRRVYNKAIRSLVEDIRKMISEYHLELMKQVYAAIVDRKYLSEKLQIESHINYLAEYNDIKDLIDGIVPLQDSDPLLDSLIEFDRVYGHDALG